MRPVVRGAALQAEGCVAAGVRARRGGEDVAVEVDDARAPLERRFKMGWGRGLRRSVQPDMQAAGVVVGYEVGAGGGEEGRVEKWA